MKMHLPSCPWNGLRARQLWFVVLVLFCCGKAKAQDLAELEQRAVLDAVDEVADSVVEIRTVGGLDQVDGQEIASGPTTGLVVRSDGYIVASAYGFVQQPASIQVRLPSGDYAVAEIVGRDHSRKLVLLKVDDRDGLPVPEPVPLEEVEPGWHAAALGRTFDPERVSISTGIVSALNRQYGRAVQTDANVSAANYGGPLVDIQGRVLGVLVPMSPQASGVDAEDSLAGAEFYDSGIGFAIPLEHILETLERWIEQGDLHRGLLGIGLASGSAYAEPAKITAVWPQSPAEKAGWQTGDVIVDVDGHPVETQADLRFLVAPRYAGDVLKVAIRRDGKTIDADVVLAEELQKYRHAFLGVLPAASDDTSDGGEGVLVGAVWPESPADRAGVQSGDRVLEVNGEGVSGVEESIAKLNGEHPGNEIALTLQRGSERQELNVQLAELPDEILERNSIPPADDAAETGENEASDVDLEPVKLPEFPQASWIYRPANSRGAPGLLLWLHVGDEVTAGEISDSWQQICERDNVTLLIASPAEKQQWRRDDLAFLGRLLALTQQREGTDPSRIAVVGIGKAGQMAHLLGLNRRSPIRGVITVDAPLPRTLSIPDISPNRRVAFLTLAAAGSPLAVLVKRDARALAESGFPTTELEARRGMENDELSPATRDAISRWLAGLRRF